MNAVFPESYEEGVRQGQSVIDNCMQEKFAGSGISRGRVLWFSVASEAGWIYSQRPYSLLKALSLNGKQTGRLRNIAAGFPECRGNKAPFEFEPRGL